MGFENTSRVMTAVASFIPSQFQNVFKWSVLNLYETTEMTAYKQK